MNYKTFSIEADAHRAKLIARNIQALSKLHDECRYLPDYEVRMRVLANELKMQTDVEIDAWFEARRPKTLVDKVRFWWDVMRKEGGGK